MTVLHDTHGPTRPDEAGRRGRSRRVSGGLAAAAVAAPPGPAWAADPAPLVTLVLADCIPADPRRGGPLLAGPPHGTRAHGTRAGR